MNTEAQETGSSLHICETTEVPLDLAARHLRDVDTRLLAYVALTNASHGGCLRLAELPVTQERNVHVPLHDRDAIIGLVLPLMGGDLIISGSQGLLSFLDREADLFFLDEVVPSLVGPNQGRFVGRLGYSIGRFGGRWRSLKDSDRDYIVIGSDERTGRLYAIRRERDGAQDGLCYADPRPGEAPDWRWFARGPDLCRAILDASRFTLTDDGRGNKLLTSIIHLRDQRDRYENRLLRIANQGEQPTLMWSEPFTGMYRVLREDRRRQGLLLEERHADTHLVHRMPLESCVPQQLYVYLLGFRD